MKHKKIVRKYKTTVLVNYLMFCLILTGCSANIGISDRGVLEPEKAYLLINERAQDADFIIMDVRTPEEFQQGHLQGAINMDCSAEDFRRDLKNLDKNKTYLIYCGTGRRSKDVLRLMSEEGFKNIYHLQKGITGWNLLGYPTTK